MKKSKLKSKIRTTATITLAGLSSSAFAIENTVKDNVSENKSENVQSLPANMSLSAEKTANFIDYVTPSPFRLVKYYNSINIEEGSTGGAFFQPSNNLIYNNRGSKESKIDLISRSGCVNSCKACITPPSVAKPPNVFIPKLYKYNLFSILWFVCF